MSQSISLLFAGVDREELSELLTLPDAAVQPVAVTCCRALDEPRALALLGDVDAAIVRVACGQDLERFEPIVKRLDAPITLALLAPRALAEASERDWTGRCLARGADDVLCDDDLRAGRLVRMLRIGMARERRLRGREQRAGTLYAIASGLARAATSDEIGEVMLDGTLALGARACALLAVSDSDLVLTHARGYEDALLRRFARFSRAAENNPISEAARRQEAIWLDDHDALAARYGTDHALARAGTRAALPLVADGHTLGVLGLTFAHEHALRAEERGALEALATSCAHALARARMLERLRRRMLEEQRLLGMAGHDLRSPLHVIMMGSDTLAAQPGVSPQDRWMLERMAESARRAASMVQELLELTRAQSAIQPAPEDLFALLRACVVDFRLRVPDCPIALSFEGSGLARIDRDRIAQVLHNLLANAAQYRGAGSSVEVRGQGLGERVYVEVQNRGPVLPEAQLSTLFEPMQRGQNGGEQGSLGLGLFIVRSLVEAHGGRVWVRSRVPDGTTFVVELPREPRAAVEPQGGDQAARRALVPKGAVPSSYASLLSALGDGPMAALLVHWCELGGPAHLPHPRTLDRARFLAWLPDMFVVRVVSGEGTELRFRYEELGGELLRRFGSEPVPEGVDASSDPLQTSFLAAYQRCARSRRPVFDYLRSGAGRAPCERFSRLLLPFSEDGAQLSHLIGMAVFDGLSEASDARYRVAPPIGEC